MHNKNINEKDLLIEKEETLDELLKKEQKNQKSIGKILLRIFFGF